MEHSSCGSVSSSDDLVVPGAQAAVARSRRAQLKYDERSSKEHLAQDVIRPETVENYRAVGALKQRWSETEELLQLRKRLMATNKREVEGIIEELEHDFGLRIHDRDCEVDRLRAALRSSEARLDATAARLEAAEQTLVDTQQAATARDAVLTQELQYTRAELSGMAAKVEKLIAAHRVAKLKTHEQEVKARDAARLQEDAERKESLALDRLHDAIGRLESAEQKLLSANEMIQQLRNNRLTREVVDSETHRARVTDAMSSSERRSSSELLELFRLSQYNNSRILSMLSHLGVATDYGHDAKVLRRAGEVFRLIRAVSNGRFQFLGDAASVHGMSGIDPVAAQDIKAAVHEHNSLEVQRIVYDASHGASRGCSPLSIEKSPQEPDPLLRLHTEKDSWIPTPVVSFVSRFRARWFPDAPLDLFYTLLVELSKMFRQHSGISCASNAADAVANDDFCSRVAATSSRDDVAEALFARGDIMQDNVAMDAVRCVTGLRSLVAHWGDDVLLRKDRQQNGKEVLVSSLRTVEVLLARVRRLETERIRSVTATSDCFGACPCDGVVGLERAHRCVQQFSTDELSLVADVQDALRDLPRVARAATQSSGDRDLDTVAEVVRQKCRDVMKLVTRSRDAVLELRAAVDSIRCQSAVRARGGRDDEVAAKRVSAATATGTTPKRSFSSGPSRTLKRSAK